MVTLSGILYLVVCYFVGCFAEERNRSKWFWALVACFISPVFAFIVLLLLGRKN